MMNAPVNISMKSIPDFALAQEESLLISIKLLQRRMNLLRAIGFVKEMKKCSPIRKQQFVERLKEQFMKISEMEQISQQIIRKLNKFQRAMAGLKKSQQKKFCYQSINRTITQLNTDKRTEEISEILLCDLLEEHEPQIMIEDCPSIQYSIEEFYFDPPKEGSENESQKVCKMQSLQRNNFQQQQESEGNDFY